MLVAKLDVDFEPGGERLLAVSDGDAEHQPRSSAMRPTHDTANSCMRGGASLHAPNWLNLSRSGPGTDAKVRKYDRPSLVHGLQRPRAMEADGVNEFEALLMGDSEYENIFWLHMVFASCEETGTNEVDGTPWVSFVVPDTEEQVFFQVVSFTDIARIIDSATYEAIDPELPPDDIDDHETSCPELVRLWYRNAWIIERLTGEERSDPVRDERDWEKDRRKPNFANYAPYILHWMWRSLYLSEDARAAELAALARTSTDRIVRHAGALVERVLEGKNTMVGHIDVGEQRKAIQRRTEEQQRTAAAERAGAESLVKTLQELETTAPELLQAVLDDPASEEPYLALADWLEERNDPRAELIRMQMLDTSDPERESELMGMHTREWLASCSLTGVMIDFYQGLPYRFHTGYRDDRDEYRC